jgi:hypothetical protein
MAVIYDLNDKTSVYFETVTDTGFKHFENSKETRVKFSLTILVVKSAASGASISIEELHMFLGPLVPRTSLHATYTYGNV